jgi:hypothetical protein
MNDKNLKPIRTKSEAREKGAKGGKASGKVRAEKKAAREIAEAIFSMPAKAGELIDIDDADSLDDILHSNPSVKAAIISKLAKKAADGNIKAAELLLTISGDYSKSVYVGITDIDKSAAELDEYFARKFAGGVTDERKDSK